MVAAAAMGAQVLGGLVQGVGAYSASRANAKALKLQARGEMVSGAAEEARVREAARQQIGAQAAAQYANGMEGGSGSALDALKESQIAAALDALEVRRQAQVRADELTARARLTKRQGTFALATSILGAAGQAAGQVDDWANARRGRTR